MTNRLYFQWHITNRCNNRCKHCYQEKHEGGEISFENSKAIIEDIKNCCEMLEAEPVIAVTGGDPFLHKNLWEILQLVKKQIKIGSLSILGNPEGIDNEIIKKLKEIKPNHVQFSLDGTEQTHDKIRYKGSFKKTISAIEMLTKNNIPAFVMSTVSGINHKEMQDVIDIAYSSGASHWQFSRWIPKKGDCGITPKQYWNFLEQILNYHALFEKRGYMPTRKEPLITAYKKELPDEKSICGGCGLGSSTLTLMPDFTVMGCRRHPESILGKWHEKGDLIDFFVNNKKMQKFRQSKKIKGCGDCAYLYNCRGCRAAAFAATGNHFGKDPQCLLSA